MESQNFFENIGEIVEITNAMHKLAPLLLCSGFVRCVGYFYYG
jgi:hypothetical protein